LNPRHSPVNYELSLIVAAGGNPEKAIRYLEGTIHERESFEPNALLGLAHTELLQKGDMHAKPAHLVASLQYLEIALSLQKRAPHDKELVKVNMTLGWLRMKSLEFEKAEVAFVNALKLTPLDELPDDIVLTFLGSLSSNVENTILHWRHSSGARTREN
jgi:hypothetical protein